MEIREGGNLGRLIGHRDCVKAKLKELLGCSRKGVVLLRDLARQGALLV